LIALIHPRFDSFPRRRPKTALVTDHENVGMNSADGRTFSGTIDCIDGKLDCILLIDGKTPSPLLWARGLVEQRTGDRSFAKSGDEFIEPSALQT